MASPELGPCNRDRASRVFDRYWNLRQAQGL